MKSGVAAGHPATCEAGIEILEDGGSAADAAVAACLASCVAETVMTGLLGGGHAIYWDAGSKAARNLDCFVAVPSGTGAPMVELARAVRRGARPLRDRRCVLRRAGRRRRNRRAVARARSAAVGARSSSPRFASRATACRCRPRTSAASRCSSRCSRSTPARASTRREARSCETATCSSSPGSCARSSCFATRARDSVYSGLDRGGVAGALRRARRRRHARGSRGVPRDVERAGRGRVRRDAVSDAPRALGSARHALLAAAARRRRRARRDARPPDRHRRRHDEPRHASTQTATSAS